jgi:hypothetical protein
MMFLSFLSDTSSDSFYGFQSFPANLYEVTFVITVFSTIETGMLQLLGSAP